MTDLSSLKAPITEIYTDTLQGEGSTVGKLCSFIRYTGCHRECSWCDSKQTWKPGMIETRKMSVQEQVDFLVAGKARRLIITGGEPLLHQDKPYFQELIKALFSEGFCFEVETEGTHAPNRFLAMAAHSGLQFNCSPKLKLAGMGDLSDEYAKKLPFYVSATSLSMLYGLGAIFKFVVVSADDVVEALALLHKAIPDSDTNQLRKRMYIMPEGVTREVQLERMLAVIDLAIEYGVNFSPRLHVLRWNDKKGV